jgi:SAM-dependent methyltransferase
MIGYTKRKYCAGCDETDFLSVLSLGEVPLAGVFPLKEELENESKYPLNLLFCKECNLVQTDSFIEPQILFEDYRYISSIGLSNHFQKLANILDEKYGDIEGFNILEIGCNDGVLLEPLSKLGANVEGVDPAKNIVKLAKDKGLKVYEEYFNDETFGGEEFKDKYDLVLSNNTFAHIPDIQSVVRGVKHVLRPEGDFVFEVHYLQSLIDGKQWDNIYHEHIFYHSITGLNNLFNKYDMTLINFEEIPIHSGSIRVTVTNRNTYAVSQKVLDRIELESKTVANVDYLRSYGEDVRNHITNFNNTIEELQKNHNIAGYGASGRANMFCNLTNINSNIVKFIVDESPERCGRYIANTDIPIVDVETLKNSDVDLLIIFAWNYSKMIIEKTQFRKFKYLVAFPTVQIVDTYEELKGFDSI